MIFAFGSGLLSIFFALLFYRFVNNKKCGDEKMVEFSKAIQEGSMSYLCRLYRVLVLIASLIGILIFFSLGWQMAAAYLFGCLCSAVAGYFGMFVATRANAKVAWAARQGIGEAFPVGFYSGAVMGLSVVGLALIGMSLVYFIFKDPKVVLGFSFGASLLALLAKAGGGIYTKTADISADLVGKMEENLAEDDPRNPGVIADNVGDNVGDVAGMGADIFDSYIASAVAVMILGFELYHSQIEFVVYPLVLGGVGIIASLLGMIFVRISGNDPKRGLNQGTVATTVIFSFLALLSAIFLGIKPVLGVFLPTLAGLLAGIIIGFTSDRFTDIDRPAVQNTAHAAKTGPAVLILEGFSYGLFSIVPSILGICLALVTAWFTAEYFGIAGTYGVSVAAVGLLSITGMIVSADAYGPIVDNAKGCAQAAKESKETIAVCDRLDAAGNTAKAITKGFTIGAAALTVLALFSAYVQITGVAILDLRNPGVVVGLFLGAMMPPLFSAMLILSVSKNAKVMVSEIRRQFREIPGILEGKVKPDSNKCVDIASKGALKSLIVPGSLSVLVPLFVGFVLGPNSLGGFLAGSIVTGIIFAIFMVNSGGLWDNAKKFIEDGAFGGKGSEAHKAAIVGDTVGDPFKDTAGPSINTLITVMSLTATVFGSLIAKYAIFRL